MKGSKLVKILTTTIFAVTLLTTVTPKEVKAEEPCSHSHTYFFNNGSAVHKAKCAKCGAALPQNAKFCLECGEKVAPAVPADMIVCPECGNTVSKGKFCPECGHKFITVCPKCGKDVVAGAKFCLECGEKL